MLISVHKDCGSRHNACTGQIRLGLTTERKRAQASTPKQEAICNWSVLTKGKSAFSNSMSLGISTTPKGRPPAQEKSTNTKQTQWYFCGLLFNFALFRLFFIGLLPVCFVGIFVCFHWCLLFYCFYFERKTAYNTGWVGKWGALGGGETWLKIHRMIILNRKWTAIYKKWNFS